MSLCRSKWRYKSVQRFSATTAEKLLPNDGPPWQCLDKRGRNELEIRQKLHEWRSQCLGQDDVFEQEEL